MIANCEDFCLWNYVVIDELLVGLRPWLRRPGPMPTCSDSELLTLAIVGECLGWAVETERLVHWQAHRDLFAHLPSQSRFNRRRRQLADLFHLVRRALLDLLDVAADHPCAIDSLPVPVMAFHLVPGSAATSTGKAAGATFGKVASKGQTIFGYQLHLLVTLGGVIRNFELAPAHGTDLAVGTELLAEHTDLDVLGDKGYISEPVATALRHERGIALLTVPRRNQRRQLPEPIRRLLNGARQIIETVNSQLDQQFPSETNHAHTFWGLCARLQTKLAAHTLCGSLNRLLGNPDILHIKALAFAI